MSTRFRDGPAMNVLLELQRAPVFLRVVQDVDGKWDALDQLDDVPAAGEQIYVYALDGDVATGIACSRGPQGGCRRFWHVDYCYYPQQPTQAELRDAAFWHRWTAEQYEKLETKPRGVA